MESKNKQTKKVEQIVAENKKEKLSISVYDVTAYLKTSRESNENSCLNQTN